MSKSRATGEPAASEVTPRQSSLTPERLVEIHEYVRAHLQAHPPAPLTPEKAERIKAILGQDNPFRRRGQAFEARQEVRGELAELTAEDHEWIAEQIKNAPPISEHAARVLQAVINAHKKNPRD